MSLSHSAIHRPVFTTMVVLIVIILGVIALMRLPIDFMPDVTLPTLSVGSSYENASPEEMEELVTRPIEEALSAVPGVEEISSVSSEGNGSVRVTFAWGTDLADAANDIRDRLDRVIGRLPEDATRPTLWKFDLASFPILVLGASSTIDPVELRRMVDDQVKYRIECVPGVAGLDVWGGLEREIHVDVRPDLLKACGLSLDQVMAQIQSANLNLPAGEIDQGRYELTIRVPGEFLSLDEIGATVIAKRDGVTVRVRDVAAVSDSWTKVRQIVRINGEPGVRMAIRKQSGTNTVEVARLALEEIDRINRDIPQIRIVSIVDTSDYIQRSLSNVSSSAIYGGGLAVLVLLFFLRNIRSTAVIATAIPISIIASFTMMYFSGFTLNLMTMGGLALGIGMLVDNAIVVLENIYRLREGGMDRIRAAEQGSEEVMAAIVASTLTTVAVFLPLVFVRGMTGVMFKQLAIIISFALMCSMAVAMSLVPMLSARVLTGEFGRRRHSLFGPLLKPIEAFLTSLENGYRGLLHLALRHRVVTVIGALLLLGGSLALVPMVGVEYMPATDEGEVRVEAEMEVGTRIDVFDRVFRTIETIVRDEVPERKNIVSSVGGGRWGRVGAHRGDIQLSLVPQAGRKRSSEQVAADLRKRLAGMPGVTIRTRAGQGLYNSMMRRASGVSDRLSVDVRGHDLDTADALAARVRKEMEQVRGVTDVRVSRLSGSPEQMIVIDRQKAADLRLSVSQVANTLHTALAGTSAGDFREAGNEYSIRVRLKDVERMSLDDILDLTITNTEGEAVTLRNVVELRPRTGPVTIERKDQERVITVSSDISDRPMGDVIGDLIERIRTIPLPRDFTVSVSGDYEEQKKAFTELLLGLGLSLVLVYMVMACQYESLRDPFVVMFSVPLAAIGVVLVLFLTDTTFNVQSFIGCIMLGGIVVNNAILLVDHINLLRRRDGMGLREAIEEAGRRRLRPILMTALTTMLGLLPLAIGFGEGGEAQAPLARTVIGGLGSAALITLVVVPVVYSLFEGWLPAKEKHEGSSDAAGEAAR